MTESNDAMTSAVAGSVFEAGGPLVAAVVIGDGDRPDARARQVGNY